MAFFFYSQKKLIINFFKYSIFYRYDVIIYFTCQTTKKVANIHNYILYTWKKKIDSKYEWVMCRCLRPINFIIDIDSMFKNVCVCVCKKKWNFNFVNVFKKNSLIHSSHLDHHYVIHISYFISGPIFFIPFFSIQRFIHFRQRQTRKVPS